MRADVRVCACVCVRVRVCGHARVPSVKVAVLAAGRTGNHTMTVDRLKNVIAALEAVWRSHHKSNECQSGLTNVKCCAPEDASSANSAANVAAAKMLTLDSATAKDSLAGKLGAYVTQVDHGVAQKKIGREKKDKKKKVVNSMKRVILAASTKSMKKKGAGREAGEGSRSLVRSGERRGRVVGRGRGEDGVEDDVEDEQSDLDEGAVNRVIEFSPSTTPGTPGEKKKRPPAAWTDEWAAGGSADEEEDEKEGRGGTRFTSNNDPMAAAAMRLIEVKEASERREAREAEGKRAAATPPAPTRASIMAEMVSLRGLKDCLTEEDYSDMMAKMVLKLGAAIA